MPDRETEWQPEKEVVIVASRQALSSSRCSVVGLHLQVDQLVVLLAGLKNGLISVSDSSSRLVRFCLKQTLGLSAAVALLSPIF